MCTKLFIFPLTFCSRLFNINHYQFTRNVISMRSPKITYDISCTIFGVCVHKSLLIDCFQNSGHGDVSLVHVDTVLNINWAASSEFGILSPMRAAKVQASLRIRAVSPEPSLLAHTSSESRGTFRQRARSLAPLNGWACAVKICHDGMLEDTNSLDGVQFYC